MSTTAAVNMAVGVAQEIHADDAVTTRSALSRAARAGAARLVRTAFRRTGPAGTAGASGLP
ncbi:hypothetical protein [Streptomyces sp. NPDC014685]|uniref:hypothetical protein n=1 Tax=Streptomyces sp. NPDC014685 TaxID=3364881 RepID=UPI0036F5706E